MRPLVNVRVHPRRPRLHPQPVPHGLRERHAGPPLVARVHHVLEGRDGELAGREDREPALDRRRVQRRLEALVAAVLASRVFVPMAVGDPVDDGREVHRKVIVAPAAVLGVVVVRMEALYGITQEDHELEPDLVLPVPARDRRRHGGVHQVPRRLVRGDHPLGLLAPREPQCHPLDAEVPVRVEEVCLLAGAPLAEALPLLLAEAAVGEQDGVAEPHVRGERRRGRLHHADEDELWDEVIKHAQVVLVRGQVLAVKRLEHGRPGHGLGGGRAGQAPLGHVVLAQVDRHVRAGVPVAEAIWRRCAGQVDLRVPAGGLVA
mmetsp:Transcript_92740/g.262523  ORF Transcript_92740/g.262523 Transcript_92740/m.262523 type:complete len:318 (+) Transcript_92740:300-1253(+)